MDTLSTNRSEIDSSTRHCGSCTLCCKLPGVHSLPEDELVLTKPEGQWCPHCVKTSGCRVYEQRPQPCRNFACLWLAHPEMVEELQPNRIHVIFYGLTDEAKNETGAIAVLMEDPQYYAFGESMMNARVQSALKTLRQQGNVMIVNGSRTMIAR